VDARRQKSRQILELVGLKGWENHYPHELSGGMQQRVGLGRALAVDPEIMLCDEPFSALDPLIRRDMQNELLNLQKTLHKTIIFITHDFLEAIKLGDRIAIMKDGEIVQLGTPQEIVAHPVNDYVREFTRDVPRAKVLTAETIMLPPGETPKDTESVPHHWTLEQLIPLVLGTDRLLQVVDNANNVIGQLDRKTILAAMAEAS
jgi:glycine betaine/proline transport system ATP-binding protein